MVGDVVLDYVRKMRHDRGIAEESRLGEDVSALAAENVGRRVKFKHIVGESVRDERDFFCAFYLREFFEGVHGLLQP